MPKVACIAERLPTGIHVLRLEQDPTCPIATWGIATIPIGNPFGTGVTLT
jgi:hypothetical protein